MKRIVHGALICALIVVVSMALWPASASAAGIAIYVDDGFVDDPVNHKWDTIQEGIDDATNGAYDTVYVYAGTYNENVVVNKNTLTIHGQSASLVTLNGQDSGYTIDMTAGDVRVRQLKIIGGDPAGVHWGNVDRGVLEKCDITDNAIGVSLESLLNQTIECNRVHDNSGDGIEVRDSELKDLTMNTIYSNFDGISLYNSPKITIWYNKSYLNTRYGIYVDSVSYDNKIYLNDFEDNGVANGYSDRVAADNTWETPNKAAWLPYCYDDNPYSGFRGNYWGDYSGLDDGSGGRTAGDGVGDNPSSYPLGLEADSYPLMSSYTNYPSTCGGSVPSCTGEVAPPSPPGDGNGDGCFIATAAYGTSTAAEIDNLRAFRDEVLLQNSLGSQLVNLYYEVSPPVADFISEHDVLRTLVRELLVDPVAWLVEATQAIWGK